MKNFCDRVVVVSLLVDSSLILVGDINLTLSSDEIWGSKVVNDYLNSSLK